MTNESQIRQDVLNACTRVLYEDRRYIIGVDKLDPDECNLLVNDVNVFLDRGTLSELARADVRRLEISLSMVGERVLHEMRTKNIPLEELGWALAKAVIRDQEDYASCLVSGNMV